ELLKDVIHDNTALLPRIRSDRHGFSIERLSRGDTVLDDVERFSRRGGERVTCSRLAGVAQTVLAFLNLLLIRTSGDHLRDGKMPLRGMSRAQDPRLHELVRIDIQRGRLYNSSSSETMSGDGSGSAVSPMVAGISQPRGTTSGCGIAGC